jgi:hypothetical protein
MREWDSYSDDIMIDDDEVKEYTIRFKTTEYEVYKRIEGFFQRLMDEPQTDEEQFCRDHKCTFYRPQEGGCTKNTGDCPFEEEPQTEREGE